MNGNVFARRGFWIFGFSVMLSVAVAAFGFNRVTDSGRGNCPGKVVCPLTGEEVCKDQCPLVDANRADCPGKVECPLTGDLVCRDDCPLAKEDKSANSNEALSPCCRGKK